MVLDETILGAIFAGLFLNIRVNVGKLKGTVLPLPKYQYLPITVHDHSSLLTDHHHPLLSVTSFLWSESKCFVFIGYCFFALFAIYE